MKEDIEEILETMAGIQKEAIAGTTGNPMNEDSIDLHMMYLFQINTSTNN